MSTTSSTGGTRDLRDAILPTYGRYDLTLVRGEGSHVWDDAGKCYLDCIAGIAVIAVGHCNPVVRAAAEEQLGKLWHVSNLYWTEPMLRLAQKLSDRFGGAQAFFCNSGAEGTEAALKYARKATGKPGFVGDAIADPLTGIHAARLGWERRQSGRAARIILSMRDIAAEALRSC